MDLGEGILHNICYCVMRGELHLQLQSRTVSICWVIQSYKWLKGNALGHVFSPGSLGVYKSLWVAPDVIRLHVSSGDFMLLCQAHILCHKTSLEREKADSSRFRYHVSLETFNTLHDGETLVQTFQESGDPCLGFSEFSTQSEPYAQGGMPP